MKLYSNLLFLLFMPVILVYSSYTPTELELGVKLAFGGTIDFELAQRSLSIDGMNDDEIAELKEYISKTIFEEAKKAYLAGGGMADGMATIKLKELGITDVKSRNLIIDKLKQSLPSKSKPKITDTPRQAKKSDIVVAVDPEVEKWAMQLKGFDPDTQRFEIINALREKKVADNLRMSIMIRINQLRAGAVLQKTENESPVQAKEDRQKAAQEIKKTSATMQDVFAEIKARKKVDIADQKLQQLEKVDAQAQSQVEQEEARKQKEKAEKDLLLARLQEKQSLEILKGLFAAQEALQQELFDQAREALKNAEPAEQSAAKDAVQEIKIELKDTQQQQQEVEEQKENVRKEINVQERASITKEFMYYVEKRVASWLKHLPSTTQVFKDSVREILGENFTEAQVSYVQGFLQMQKL